MGSPEIVVFGSVASDVFVQSHEFETEGASKLHPLRLCFDLGAKIELDTIERHLGGGAANAAVTFARLLRPIKRRALVSCIARLGNEEYSTWELVSKLGKDNIDTRFLQHDPHLPTAFSCALLSRDGRRSLLVSRGASVKLNSAQIPWNKIKKAKIFYITSLGGNFLTIAKIFKVAADSGIKIAWNPGKKELAAAPAKLMPYVRQCAYLILNNYEAADLLNLPVENQKVIYKKLKQEVPGTSVITAGSKGAYAINSEGTFYVPAQKVKMVDATGAGDAFGSGFVCVHHLTGDIKKALGFAALNSASVIERIGANVGALHKIPAKLPKIISK